MVRLDGIWRVLYIALERTIFVLLDSKKEELLMSNLKIKSL